MAIKQHYVESIKARNFAHNMAFKKLGYKQQFIAGPPVTLVVEITNSTYQSLIKPKHFCGEIEDTLLTNGAIRGIDYEMVTE